MLVPCVGEVASLALWRARTSAWSRTENWGESGLGAHREQKGTISLPIVNIVHGLARVKKLAPLFTTTFVEGARAIVIAGVARTSGGESQLSS